MGLANPASTNRVMSGMGPHSAAEVQRVGDRLKTLLEHLLARRRLGGSGGRRGHERAGGGAPDGGVECLDRVEHAQRTTGALDR
jgi:hypothetical protein